jgi:hypothetical protein
LNKTIKIKSSEKMYNVLEEMFSIHFSRYFCTDEEVDFIDCLKSNTELFVFSGVLRDFLLRYNEQKPRDFDFVIGKSNKKIEKLLNRYLVRRTQFGGYKCLINNKIIDIWALEDTWAIKKYRPFYLQNYLPLTAFFNITAAVYLLNENKLFIHDSLRRFLEDKNHRELDFVLEDNPYPALCVVKSLELMDKFKLPVADRLKNYLIHFNKVLNNVSYHEAQMKHFGIIKYDYYTINNTIINLYNRSRYVDKLKSTDSQMLLFDKNEINFLENPKSLVLLNSID